MRNAGKILLIEDDLGASEGLARVLGGEGYELTVVHRGDEGLVQASNGDFDAVITDLRLPGLDGIEVVRQVHAAKPRLPIILMTAHGTTETAIQATKLGAFDYLLKPFEMEELIALTEKAVASSRMMTEPVELGEMGSARDAIIGNGRLMQGIYKEIGRVAAKPVTVLIRGDTGTGKELIARAIYQHSDRASAPFVAINCAAIPETLLESELFGHERGAFTGALTRRIGRFEQAHLGTLFLDEIGDITLSTQAKLLRVLQEKTIQRLGGKETIPVDVRIIAATHRDLESAIKEKLFREDLYYRLNVVVITLPSLRDRKEDIPALAQFFIRKYGPELGVSNASVQPAAMDYLQTLPWPGNVRELENVIRQSILLARGYPISVEHMRHSVGRPNVGKRSDQPALKELVGEFLNSAKRGEIQDAYARVMQMAERELFGQAIELAQGNQAKAARWLGISRLTMREKLTNFGIHPARDGTGAEDGSENQA
ncbi:MAG: two component, sigma54 specific, transcriptional regulator, Fis family [Verrucomicrobiales bacterium]|nr:two component, sigma54 specific, transcriptional regulator, Fis family [Verrucomicrobiales bacterium]